MLTKKGILQKLLSLVLVLTIVLSLTVPAFSEQTDDPYLPPDQNEGSEGVNIIENPGFEESTNAWEEFGGGKATISDEVAHEGKKAMKLDDQHVKYTNWVRVGNGETYKFGAWVYGKATLASAMLRGDGGIEYAYHAEGGEDGKWTYLEGFLTVNNSSVTHIDMTVVKGEGTVYVDDVSMNMVVHNMLRDPGFEDGGKTWIEFGDGPVTVVEDIVHNGSKAMMIQNLPAKYGSWIEVNEGQSFTLSVWVYGKATLVSAMMKEDGSVEYVYHQEGGEDGKWTQLKGSLIITAGYTRVDFSVVNAGNKVYVDDAFMGYLGGGGKNSGEMPAQASGGVSGGGGPVIYGDNKFTNASFELGAAGWLYFDNTTVLVDKENAYSGTTSLVSGSGNGGVRSQGVAVTDGIYKTGGWVYGPARLQLALFNIDGTVDYMELDVGGSDGKWTYLEGRFYVPGNKVSAVSVIFITASDRILIDDVTLNKQGEEPSEEVEEEDIYGDNKLDNSSFELGTSDWMYFTDAPGQADEENSYTGNASLVMGSDKGGVKSPGIAITEGTYKTGAWVYGNASMKLAVFKSDGSVEYVDIANGGTDGEWTYLEGYYSVSGSDVTAVSIIFQTEDDRILIDDVTLNKKGEKPTEEENPGEETATYGENLLAGAGFESGATDWHYFSGDAVGETDTTNGYTGTSSLIMESSKGGVKSPGIAVSTGSYKTGAWVYGPAAMKLAAFKTDGTIDYYDIASGGSAGEWTYLEGGFDVSDPNIATVAVIFQTDAERILIDDVTFNKKTEAETTGENLIENSGFEQDASGWKTFSGAAVETTKEEVHDGEQAVKVDQNDPVTLADLIDIGTNIVYKLSAWVYGKVNVFGALYDQNGVHQGYYNNWQPFITAGVDGEWTEISGEVLITDDTTDKINIEFRPVDGDIYLDDVSFAEKNAEQTALTTAGEEATAFAEEPAAAEETSTEPQETATEPQEISTEPQETSAETQETSSESEETSTEMQETSAESEQTSAVSE